MSRLANAKAAKVISTDASRVTVRVIRTDERVDSWRALCVTCLDSGCGDV